MTRQILYFISTACINSLKGGGIYRQHNYENTFVLFVFIFFIGKYLNKIETNQKSRKTEFHCLPGHDLLNIQIYFVSQALFQLIPLRL